MSAGSTPRGVAGRRGRFIVLDGIDGCGKSTQAARLVERLAHRAEREPLHVREPGSTPVGEGLRALLLSPEHDLDAGTETLILAAARRALLRERVAPALAEGRDVVCERFHPSTYAYQAEAGGLDGAAVLALLRGWAGEPEPDLVILLEIAPAEAARRRGPGRDRIEAKGLAYQERVAQGYRRYAERAPGTVVIDGARGVEDVAADIAREVERAG
jgi:dTMP kinase